LAVGDQMRIERGHIRAAGEFTVNIAGGGLHFHVRIEIVLPHRKRVNIITLVNLIIQINTEIRGIIKELEIGAGRGNMVLGILSAASEAEGGPEVFILHTDPGCHGVVGGELDTAAAAVPERKPQTGKLELE